MPRMTLFRRELLRFIKEYHKENNRTPSIRLLAKELHKSPSTIQFHLKKLDAMGRIRSPRYHKIEIIDD